MNEYCQQWSRVAGFELQPLSLAGNCVLPLPPAPSLLTQLSHLPVALALDIPSSFLLTISCGIGVSLK